MNEQAPSKKLLDGLRHNERSVANEPWLQDMCGNAADEIERLQLQVYALTNANKSLADHADGQPPNRHTAHEPPQASKERIAARVDQLVKELGFGDLQMFRGEIIGTLIEYTNFLRAATEPPAEQDTGRYCVEVAHCDRNADFHIWDGHCNTAAAADAEALQVQINRAAQPPVPARTDADYAIEHAGYLATAAEQFITSIDEFDAAANALEEGTDDETDDELKRALDHAFEVRCDHRNGLANAIYEFRKRAERATSTKEVRCNCAEVPPTMPTFRTQHLPTCPCLGLGEEVKS
jgi:hypothetical protein